MEQDFLTNFIIKIQQEQEQKDAEENIRGKTKCLKRIVNKKARKSL